ncbi:DUF4258 domain-containing protein [Daejeonella sp.]|uniref:DUF4258 domain-containing protein n=1 Tax=Daejeonella sp. TaxID=2805397 RepID=UPI002BF99AEA|nr:DUF4258 domain-containing protein [Daejeonella sp.]HQT24963.1 DUF4258 domain-containing protein [Daejeonella sp.]HQT59560.1 DUF4258 domain-containing protein [Daejeonella sp.]
MQCAEVLYSDHAVAQMFKRDIEIKDIRYVIEYGEAINRYPDDKPYPSFLLFGFVQKRPIHVVIARDAENERCIIITAYEPDNVIWDADFRTKKK